MILLRLFYEYFLVGLFSVGGGLATIPFLSQMGEKTGWFTQQALADMIAISESTPGPIGVNMASSIGYRVAGIPGVIVATFGLVAPSLIVILIVVSFYTKYHESTLMKSAFYGLRPASLALISSAFLSVLNSSLLDFDQIKQGVLYGIHWKCVLFAVVLFFLMRKVKIHPVFFLLGSAVVGIVFHFAG